MKALPQKTDWKRACLKSQLMGKDWSMVSLKSTLERYRPYPLTKTLMVQHQIENDISINSQRKLVILEGMILLIRWPTDGSKNNTNVSSVSDPVKTRLDQVNTTLASIADAKNKINFLNLLHFQWWRLDGTQ